MQHLRCLQSQENCQGQVPQQTLAWINLQLHQDSKELWWPRPSVAEAFADRESFLNVFRMLHRQMNRERRSVNCDETTVLTAVSPWTNLRGFGDRSNVLSFHLYFLAWRELKPACHATGKETLLQQRSLHRAMSRFLQRLHDIVRIRTCRRFLESAHVSFVRRAE